MHFSEKLARLMAFHGLTQEALADIADTSQATVSRWLSGQSKPYDRSARILADFFRLDIHRLLDDAQVLDPTAHHDSSDAYHHEQVDEWIKQLTTYQEEAARLTKLIQEANSQRLSKPKIKNQESLEVTLGHALALATSAESHTPTQPQQVAEKPSPEKPLARANPIPAPKKKGMTVAEAEALHHSPPPILGEIAAGTPSAPAVGIKRRGKMIIPPGAIILETNLPPIPKPMPVMKPEKIQPAPKQPRSRPFPTTSDKALKSVPRADEEYSGADAG